MYVINIIVYAKSGAHIIPFILVVRCDCVSFHSRGANRSKFDPGWHYQARRWIAIFEISLERDNEGRHIMPDLEYVPGLVRCATLLFAIKDSKD